MMKRVTMLIGLVSLTILLAGTMTTAQFRAPSPDGLASTETGGRYAGGREPYYVGGKWIEVSYGRPIKRGREVWGSDAVYGMWLNRGAPVWRAGADVSTYLMTQAPLIINGVTVEPGGYSLFIDLALDNWTLIVSNWQPQRRYDPNNTRELWGSYGYTPDKDVVRAPMSLSTLPWSVDQLTWLFVDMSDTTGTLAVQWDSMMAAVPFTVGQQTSDLNESSNTPDPRTPPTVRNGPEDR